MKLGRHCNNHKGRAVVAAFNQEKALVGVFSVIMNLQVDLRFKLYKGHRGEESAKLTYDHKSIIPLNEVISVTGPGEEESTVFCVSSRFSNFIVETRYGRYYL